MPARFGPAGTMGQASTLEGVRFAASHGLRAFEMEFVQGARMNLRLAEEIGKLAKSLDVKLSAHCPYYINLASSEATKLRNSFRHILQTAAIVQAAGGGTIVFHPAFYQGRKPEEVFEIVEDSLQTILEKMEEQNIDEVVLGCETTGKHSQFGSLEELIRLSKLLKKVEPVLDFAHIYARQNGQINYGQIFDQLEKELGLRFANRVHCHFSGIEFTDKGERRHLPISSDSPPFRPLAKLLVERNLEPSIICESPTLETDTLEMLKIYSSLLKD